MKSAHLFKINCHPQYLSKLIIEASLRDVFIGEICDVRRHWRESEIVARAQVIGFRRDITVLSLFGNPKGLSRESVLIPTGEVMACCIDDSVLGTVVDSTGNCITRLAPVDSRKKSVKRCILDADPPDYSLRKPVNEKFETGIRVIDALITCGKGQRLGIFATAGAGKTSLMQMIVEHASADVYVVGLIGERGREVTEFVEMMKQSEKSNRSTIVYATSDASSIDRCNAALLATTIAEYFREQGCHVVLIQDSLTRYARALRDIALMSGELPARRGYPASVFDALPRFLERPGVTINGSITAFYTVLLESDDEADPIAEEIRSILDGHIYLSRHLAEKNHYPAIDVLRSLSRVSGKVCAEKHLKSAVAIREKISRIEALKMMIDLGEYRTGENDANDILIAQRENLDNWLRQSNAEKILFSETIQEINEFAS